MFQIEALAIRPGILLQQRYLVTKQLGRGSFGATFEVDDRGTAKVLKVLLTNYPKAVSLFQREAEVLSQLRHPGIPKVEPDSYFTFSSKENELLHCLVMEKIDGLNLQEWLNKNQFITQEQAVNWLKQLVEILDKIHRDFYLHRDIKPANIMLKPDGQLVLIDFGAVREVTETYLERFDFMQVTRINSPGYTPPEQSDGWAVLQSDFFALGRTFVHLLTGKHPLKFSRNVQTGELNWKADAPQITEDFAQLIDDLMATFPGQRPQSSRVILQRLRGEPFSYVNQLVGIDNRRLQIALIVSVVMTILVMAVRQLGMLQVWELQAYDQLLRARPDEGLDLRLLVVEATEEDINRYGFPLPDATLAQVVEKLEPHQPRVIGLDVFRDRPIGDGHVALASQLQHNDQLIALCSAKEASNPNKPGIKPPPKLPKDRMGFSDVVVDPDGILRRHLLFMQPYHTDPCAIDHSFSVRVALHYLAAEGIKPQTLPGDRVQLGKTVFSPLEVNTGAYQKLDARGFQLMLNYRSSQNLARRVRLAEVLSGQVDPTWVKDRIVLIGVTAPVSNATDYFFTPYSTGKWPYQKMPGVIVQAQMVSQILSAVLDKRPLLWVWNWWGEVLWAWGWSMVGGLIAWRIPRRLYLVLAASTAIGILYGICFVLLTQGGWVPLVPSALALLATGGSVVAYTVHQKRQ